VNVPLSWLLTFFESGSKNYLLEALDALPVAAEGAAEAASVSKLVGLLDGLGLSVERVAQLPAAPEGVIVVEVVAFTPVERSDHLLLAEVETGSGRVGVVTGAPNTAVGLRTALAQPGATLPAVGLEVGVRELAGVRSEGVLCSPRELGLFDYSGGLLVLGDDAPVGAALAELWPAETVIELELTPNRADAFSLLGVARDLAAKLGVPFIHPAADPHPGDAALDDGLEVRIDDSEGCSRFVLRRIDELIVAPSPLWLQRRLAALGLRPRNNLVDVTNYVTFELGQPTHAYDLGELPEGRLVVRRAHEGETLSALSEAELTFSAADLLITTPHGAHGTPVGVAGVIGGLHHSVKPETRSVALEAAHFDPVSVRKTAKRLGLATDAHTRFERGVDPDLPPLAAARVASLMAELGGGTVHPGATKVGGSVAPEVIAFRPSQVAFLTTLEVPTSQQRAYLEALGCTVEAQAEDRWQVTAPSWRFDLSLEADLVEEVARLHGYEHIGESVPALEFVPEGRDTTHRGLRGLLVGFGLQETLTYTFSSDEELARAAAPAASVRLSSPPSQERSVLRTALYPGLLSAARTNRGASLALFEVGRVFAGEETERLGLLLRGAYAGGGWLTPLEVDFYVFKGVLERLAATLGVTLTLLPRSFPMLHPGVSAAVFWDGLEVGFAGRLHPGVAAAFELDESYVAELQLPLPARAVGFQEFSRQPFAERDLAIIAPAVIPYSQLEALVRRAAGDKLVAAAPFDVYEGHPIPAGARSVALRLRFRDDARALRDDEVDGFMENVITALAQAGYAIRDR
jgi:phenylalanyl-tRNA synthetase beta chain